MADTTIYDTMAPSVGSLALAHERLIRMKVEGVFINITGDVNNLALNPTPIEMARETYGNKTKTSSDITGYNYAPSFDVEVIRDPDTKQIVASQAWFKDLVTAAFATGGANEREFQLFTDAFDEDMPVVEGTFSVAFAEGNTGFADKAVVRITLKNKGDVTVLTESPLAGTGEPILESASPSGAAGGHLIKVRGYALSSTVSATIDGQTVLELLPIDAYTVALLVPASVTGSAPIIITNSVGASDPLTYTAA
jgi:hypothetical protein